MYPHYIAGKILEGLSPEWAEAAYQASYGNAACSDIDSALDAFCFAAFGGLF